MSNNTLEKLNASQLYADAVRLYEQGECDYQGLVNLAGRISLTLKTAGVMDPFLTSAFTDTTIKMIREERNARRNSASTRATLHNTVTRSSVEVNVINNQVKVPLPDNFDAVPSSRSKVPFAKGFLLPSYATSSKTFPKPKNLDFWPEGSNDKTFVQQPSSMPGALTSSDEPDTSEGNETGIGRGKNRNKDTHLHDMKTLSQDLEINTRDVSKVRKTDADDKYTAFKIAFDAFTNSRTPDIVSIIENHILQPLLCNDSDTDSDTPPDTHPKDASFKHKNISDASDGDGSINTLEEVYVNIKPDMQRAFIKTTPKLIHLKPPHPWYNYDLIKSLLQSYPSFHENRSLCHYTGEIIVTSFIITLDPSYDRDASVKVFTTTSDLTKSTVDRIDSIAVTQAHVQMLGEFILELCNIYPILVVQLHNDHTMITANKGIKFYPCRALKRDVKRHIRVLTTFHKLKDCQITSLNYTIYEGFDETISGLAYPAYDLNGYAFKFDAVSKTADFTTNIENLVNTTYVSDINLTSDIFTSYPIRG